jgi:exopolyphosphatase / guanosine-5'-triphosphate,3'-diphosphate pyrophosphatase
MLTNAYCAYAKVNTVSSSFIGPEGGRIGTPSSGGAKKSQHKPQPMNIAEFAVIDLGANSVQLAIYRADAAIGYRHLCEYDARQHMRLADLTNARQELPQYAIDALIDVIRQFKRYCESAHIDARRINAVATSALRDAPNRDVVLGAIASQTGVDVRVLSEQQEAGYAAAAVLHRMPLIDGVVVDFGGGALRLAHVASGRVRASHTLALGTLRLQQRFQLIHLSSDGELDAFRQFVAQRCTGLHEALRLDRQPKRLIGVGGALKALGRITLAREGAEDVDVHGLALDVREIDAWMHHLRALSFEERRALPGLRAAQTDAVLYAAVLVSALIKTFGAPRIEIANVSMRDGVALAAVRELEPVLA